MAAGSQLIIDKDGIHLTTPQQFKVHAGQHIFQQGENIKAKVPILPIASDIALWSNKWDVYELFYPADFSTIKYKLINKNNNTYSTGTLDQHGRTARINHDQSQEYALLIGPDRDWSVSIDDGQTAQIFEHQCTAHFHHEQEY